MSEARVEHWPIERDEEPEILAIHTEQNWLHGTRAAPFETPLPGTCFTQDRDIAEFFAKIGSYQNPLSQDGESRILEATITLPEGAPYLRVSPLYGQYLDMISQWWHMSEQEARETGQYRREARAEYHEEATKITRAMGYRAYWADLYHGRNDACLVVLDPSAVTITRHNAPT